MLLAFTLFVLYVNKTLPGIPLVIMPSCFLIRKAIVFNGGLPVNVTEDLFVAGE
jgi:hypothetical protein